jgi:bifunctional non-homologous end joining protein LigD
MEPLGRNGHSPDAGGVRGAGTTIMGSGSRPGLPSMGDLFSLAPVRIGRRDVTVTNLDKVFFPESGLTKGDLIRYYVDVADVILPHVRNRPMQMLRYPDGVDGFFFYQKRVPNPHPDWLETVHIVFPGSGRTADFPVVTEAASLAWIVNLGCIDLHTWHCRIDDIERPDYMLIDLDPSEGNPWKHVRTIALVIKEVMDELGLPSFPKTSGATGLHILVPIRPELVFKEVRRFAKALAQEVEKRIDDQDVATTTWKVADRRGVFVDYGQNARDRTIASAYSIRPQPDARASAPLCWEEVPDSDPAEFTLQTMRARIEEVGDLTAGMWRRKTSLVPRFKKLGLEAPQP